MAAISALAEHGTRIDTLIENEGFSEAGIYAANMYHMGVPMLMIVDDYLPMKENPWNPGNFNTVFASVGDDGSLYGTIIEKMFAKYYGNYENIVGGWMGAAVAAMNGSPYMEFWLNENTDKEMIWNEIVGADAETNIITAGSNFCGSHDNTTAEGVQCGHAYSLLHAFTLSDGTRLIKCRNPWGAERYAAKWSDGSEEWTPEIINEVNELGFGPVVDENEGLFFIDLDSFMNNFSQLTINYATADWKLGWFMKLDD